MKIQEEHLTVISQHVEMLPAAVSGISISTQYIIIVPK